MLLKGTKKKKKTAWLHNKFNYFSESESSLQTLQIKGKRKTKMLKVWKRSEMEGGGVYQSDGIKEDLTRSY